MCSSTCCAGLQVGLHPSGNLSTTVTVRQAIFESSNGFRMCHMMTFMPLHQVRTRRQELAEDMAALAGHPTNRSKASIRNKIIRFAVSCVHPFIGFVVLQIRTRKREPGKRHSGTGSICKKDPRKTIINTEKVSFVLVQSSNSWCGKIGPASKSWHRTLQSWRRRWLNKNQHIDHNHYNQNHRRLYAHSHRLRAVAQQNPQTGAGRQSGGAGCEI